MVSKPSTLSVSAIEARRTEMLGRLESCISARRGLALDIVEGNADAGARDVKLGEKQAQYETALDQLDDALECAKAREDQARREAQAADRRAQAADVRSRLDAFRRHGQDLDVAAKTFVESYAAFEGEVLAMARDGVGPTVSLVRTNCRRALEAALMPTPLKVTHLAPSERHSFAELIEGWSRGIEHWCSEREIAAADKAA